MVKTIGPCLSLDAFGTIAGAITFQHALKSRAARKKPQPRYVRTDAQNEVRNTVAKAVLEWHGLTDSQRTLWKEYSDGNGNKGYHAWIYQWVRRSLMGLWQYRLPPDIGYCITGDHLVGEFIVGGGHVDP